MDSLGETKTTTNPQGEGNNYPQLAVHRCSRIDYGHYEIEKESERYYQRHQQPTLCHECYSENLSFLVDV